MPSIFSYGTLQQPDVQMSTFGRLLDGQKDQLVGFEQSLVKIEDPEEAAIIDRTHHANVVFNGDSNCRVTGTALEISDAELAAADKYEESAHYERISTTLASGREAWVYVHAGSASHR
jgi:gamma-glutamylcyclotransferase (GGCT)/AIG2-like uncharacterized protein YtfP